MGKLKHLNILLGLLVLFASCQASVTGPAPGRLSLRVNLSQGAPARTLVPDLEGAVDSYRLFLTSRNGYDPREVTSGTDQITVENLEAGTWDLKGQALDAGGTVLAEKSLTGQVLSAAGAPEISLALEPTVRNGSGHLDLSLSWPQTSGIDGLEASLQTLDGGAVAAPLPEVVLAPLVPGTPRTARITRNGLPSGVYTLVLAFSRGGVAAGTFREALNITADLTTRLWVNPADGKLTDQRSFTQGDFLNALTSLASLSVPEVPALGSGFVPDDREYTIPQVPRHKTITFTPTQALPGQVISYTWNGSQTQSILSGETSQALPLKGGDNLLEIEVTAPDRSTQGKYALTFHWTPFYTSPTGMEMVLVEGGTFQRDAVAANLSTLDTFLIGKYEVTQELWERVMGYNPNQASPNPQKPVGIITWFDAVEFCNKLSEREGLVPVYTITNRNPATGYSIGSATVDFNPGANGYRLPTNNEWSWAAMGGLRDSMSSNWTAGKNISGWGKDFSGSNGVNSIFDYAVTKKEDSIQAVGTKLPNELGIYDLSGNVQEMVHEKTSPSVSGPLNNLFGVRRSGGTYYIGGTYQYEEGGFLNLTSGYFDNSVNWGATSIGFRVARNTTPLYKVTYAATGAAEDKSFSEAYNVGDTVTVLGNAAGLTKTGAFLVGWTSSSDGIGGTVYSIGETFTMPSSHVTLYPIWIDMVSIPGGTFQRDSSASNLSTVSDFSMGKYEVTREQFDAVMGVDPSDPKYSNPVNRKEPVQRVSLYSAVAFCNKLSILAGKSTVYSVTGVSDWGDLKLSDIPTSSNSTWNSVQVDTTSDGYRLPRETEFMWASMGGYSDKIAGNVTGTPPVNNAGYMKTWSGGSNFGDLTDADLYMWSSRNAGGKLNTVGTRAPNELGLHDMSGNVWELCQDWKETYPSGVLVNYLGPVKMMTNVSLRGGSLWHHPFTGSYGSPGHRSDTLPEKAQDDLGFRLARSATPLYKLTYAATGAAVDRSFSLAYKQGDTVTLLGNVAGFYKTGYYLAGWSSQEGSQTVEHAIGSNLTMPAGHKIFHPVWLPVPAAGLIGEWLMDGSYTDSSSVNKADAVRAGATDPSTVPNRRGVTGRSFSFNNSPLSVSKSDLQFNSDSPFTLSVWSKVPASTLVVDDVFKIVVDMPTSGFQYAVSYLNKKDMGHVARSGSGGIRGVQNTSDAEPDVWRHHVLTYSGSGPTPIVSYYEDGILIGTAGYNLELSYGASVPLRIAPTGFVGAIDDLRIYSTVLTLEQIRSLYRE